MKFIAVAVAAFAALGAATPTPDKEALYLSSDKPSESSPPPPSSSVSSESGCVQCAQYCKDPSNGAAIGAACLIVKCGIKCLIG